MIHRLDKTGFTLIEVLTVNAIMALVIGVTVLFWQFILKNYDFSLNQLHITEDVNGVVRQLETELRQAQEGMQGAYPLEILNNDEIAFYADVDNDGLVERIRYAYSNGTIIRGVVKPTGNPPQYTLSTEKAVTVSRNILPNHSPIFTYYNQNWPQDTTNNPLPLASRPLNTRLIKVSIPMSVKDSLNTASQSAEAIIQIRNLKHDL